MQVVRIPVSTTNLSVGMYVSMLDRPWLETPFVFQGFEIVDRFEIEQLQAYCSQVYVDVDRGSLTKAQIRALAVEAPGGKFGAGNGNSDRHSLYWLHKVVATLGLDGLLYFHNRGHDGVYAITTTARAEAPHARLAYDRAASRYLTIFERTRRVGAVDMVAVARALKPAIDSILRNPDAMAWTVFSGKRSTRHYSRAAATAVWAVIFGRHLGFDRDALQKLATGAYLLDIGNTALPEKLLKTEGAMPLDDFARVSQHVQAGLDVLRRSREIPAEVFEMVAFHHERFDGSGYPEGHAGSALPPYGRIAGIVDSYDAMTTRTPYSPAMAGYDAARELNESRGKLFHPEVVGQFLHAIGMFPTGSIVELNDGRIGLVLEQNRHNPLQPKLLLLKQPSGKDLDPLRVFNPEDWPHGDRARQICIARGHEHGAFGIDPSTFFRNRATTEEGSTRRRSRFPISWSRFLRSR